MKPAEPAPRPDDRRTPQPEPAKAPAEKERAAAKDEEAARKPVVRITTLHHDREQAGGHPRMG
jgi:Na+-transporting methylmalonyl-CoA/oxaloacetate decarboxylase gamma subunit